MAGYRFFYPNMKIYTLIESLGRFDKINANLKLFLVYSGLKNPKNRFKILKTTLKFLFLAATFILNISFFSK
jgi:hypothetical protein